MNVHLLKALAEDWPSPVVQRTIVPANPAAGADFTIVVPGESVWAVVALTATFTTSAAVANRVPILTVTNGVNVIMRVPVFTNLAASLATNVTWLPGLGGSQGAIVANTLVETLPPLYLAAGASIGPVTALIDVADQWSAIALTVVEVLSGDIERLRNIEENIVEHARAIVALTGGI